MTRTIVIDVDYDDQRRIEDRRLNLKSGSPAIDRNAQPRGLCTDRALFQARQSAPIDGRHCSRNGTQ